MMSPPPPVQKIETACPGLFVLKPKVFNDHRGTFVKTFNSDVFRAISLEFLPQEEFFSISAKDVLRGMHFQRPPAAHKKLVYCAMGRVLDVVLDLRKDSPTHGQTVSRELSAGNREILFIPAGCAHGFLSLEDGTLMVYQTDTVHSPAYDSGIAWNSFGFDWPISKPILSQRDAEFPTWPTFMSPF